MEYIYIFNCEPVVFIIQLRYLSQPAIGGERPRRSCAISWWQDAEKLQKKDTLYCGTRGNEKNGRLVAYLPCFFVWCGIVFLFERWTISIVCHAIWITLDNRGLFNAVLFSYPPWEISQDVLSSSLLSSTVHCVLSDVSESGFKREL